MFYTEGMGQALIYVECSGFAQGVLSDYQWRGPYAWRRIRPTHLRSRHCPREPAPVVDLANKEKQNKMQHDVFFPLSEVFVVV